MATKAEIYEAMGSEALELFEAQGMRINRQLLDAMGPEAYPELFRTESVVENDQWVRAEDLENRI